MPLQKLQMEEKAMNRLTADKPVGNTERMLNFAYCDNGRVKLLYAEGKDNIDLCEYVASASIIMGCYLTDDDVMAGSCEEGCDCILSTLYTIAVQAAELRERLKQYEDTGLMPDEVEKIVDETLTLNERRHRLGLPAINDDISNFSTQRYTQGGDASE